MTRIELTTRIAAPRELCFDLARSVEALERLLEARNREIKTVAESGIWRQFVPQA